MERKAWVKEARKAVYSSQQEWANALRAQGWDIPQSTIGTWEAAGFLPTSLDYKAINLVADSLKMTTNEVLRLQGVNIIAELDGLQIPNCAVDFVREIAAMDEAKLEAMMPALEAVFLYLRDAGRD